MDIFKLVPNIPENRNYWLVRTQKGLYFEEYSEEGYIGIGWNRISDVNEIKYTNRPIADIVRERYPKEKRPGYVESQINAFVKGMKSGDVVMIPSTGSYYVRFGEILEDEIYIEDLGEDNELIGDESEEELNRDFNFDFEGCPYFKRRRVKWISRPIKRDLLDPYLFKLFYTQNTIADANPYASYIDRTLYSFFIKGDKAHLILNVTKKEDILAKDLSLLISSVLSSLDQSNEITSLNLDTDDVEIKLNVQSPGHIELIGSIPEIGIAAAVVFFVMGGSVSVGGVEVSVEGLVNKVSIFLENRRENRRIDLEHQRELRRIELNHEIEIRKLEATKDISIAGEKLGIELTEQQKKIKDAMMTEVAVTEEKKNDKL